MTFLSVGCDIAKNSFDAAVWHDQGHPLRTFPNTQEGFEKLSAKIAEHNPNQQPILLVLEPTGGYELSLVVYARAQDWQVALPNPKQTRDWAKGVGYRTKSDAQDCLMLAHYGAKQNPEPQGPLPEGIAELAGLLKRQEDVEKMRRAELNRLGQLQQQPRPSQVAIDSLQRHLKMLGEELEQLQEAIDAHVKSEPLVSDLKKRLLTIPGVGKRTVLDLIVLLYRWKVRTGCKGGHKSLTAYVGLDSQTNQSGRSFKRATISKMGSGRYRYRLYMAALGGIRGHNTLKYSYQKMVNRGKPKKVALVAASRKILVWAWALFMTGESFDASKHPLPQIVS